MSEVLIKNVEMPMHCAMCGFHGAMGDPMISQHFCKVTGVRILNPYKGRLDDCPLVPVPPHGRLIDADELVKKLPIPELGAPRWLIEQAPTIIPAEEGET